MNDHLQPPSDLALEDQTRAGSDAAWDELRARHVGAIEALARTRTTRGAAAATDSVFVELRRRIVDPVPPESPGDAGSTDPAPGDRAAHRRRLRPGVGPADPRGS